MGFGFKRGMRNLCCIVVVMLVVILFGSCDEGYQICEVRHDL